MFFALAHWSYKGFRLRGRRLLHGRYHSRYPLLTRYSHSSRCTTTRHPVHPATTTLSISYVGGLCKMVSGLVERGLLLMGWLLLMLMWCMFVVILGSSCVGCRWSYYKSENDWILLGLKSILLTIYDIWYWCIWTFLSSYNNKIGVVINW